jgi:hypothetical protein
MKRVSMSARLLSALVCGWVSMNAQCYTELFAASDADLSFVSLTFTPDGSGEFYSVFRNSASVFETDPTVGTPLSLLDDSFAEVSLTGNASVSLYGQSYSSFFVGSNGYLTFGAPDNQPGESLFLHFSLPRVSAGFDDLDPAVGGTVSYRQLDDRVAVTWQNVPEYLVFGSSNNLQVEMFFNGRIRITRLGVSSTDGLVGLSAGGGVPAGFVETDFSALGAPPISCPFADGNGGQTGACIEGQGSWQRSLQPRDFGNDGSIDAYYDPYLDLTWLADANFAQTSGFDADGRMNFTQANTWASGLTLFGGSDWRLPTLTPVNDTATLNFGFSNNGSTDQGTAKTGVGWGEDSELGYMYYVHLGNKGFYVPNDANPGSIVEQSGFGPSNTGPFANLLADFYWTDESFGSGAWNFGFNDGFQNLNFQFEDFRAWAVHSGDLIGPPAAPEPQNVPLPWVAALGLGGLLCLRGARACQRTA